MLPLLLLLAASTGAPVALRGAAPVFKAVPFGLGEVTLTSGSRLFLQAEANTNWLLGLDQSRLMCLVRTAYAYASGVWCIRPFLFPFS